MDDKKIILILQAKKDLLADFMIPWDNSITDKFQTEMKRRPDADPQIVLDVICRPLIMQKLGCKY